MRFRRPGLQVRTRKVTPVKGVGHKRPPAAWSRFCGVPGTGRRTDAESTVVAARGWRGAQERLLVGAGFLSGAMRIL